MLELGTGVKTNLLETYLRMRTVDLVTSRPGTRDDEHLRLCMFLPTQLKEVFS